MACDRMKHATIAALLALLIIAAPVAAQTIRVAPATEVARETDPKRFSAAQFCHDDSRCKAGIDLDGQPFGSVIQAGLHQPFMFVLTSQIHSSDPATRQVLANIQSIYDRLPPDGRLRIEIRGENHFFFSDD